MANITEKVILEAEDLVGHVLRVYRSTIDKAYLKSEGDLKVLSVVFATAKNGNVKAKVAVDFVESRVKDAFEREIDEKAGELFPKEEKKTNAYNLKPTPILPSHFRSALEWLIGYAKDPDVLNPLGAIMFVDPEYSKLNDMRDDLEDRSILYERAIEDRQALQAISYVEEFYVSEYDEEGNVINGTEKMVEAVGE